MTIRIHHFFLCSALLLTFASNASGQWVQTGPYGGDFLALAANGTNLFAGGDSGVYRSTDNGNSWKMLPGSPIGAVNFAVSGSNLFAGTVSGWNQFVPENGLYLSKDSGTTWTAVDSGLMGYDDITALAAIGTTIFVGTADSGIFRSTNNGKNWVVVGPTNVSVGAFAVIGTNIFASIIGEGIFLSTDYGGSWSETGWNVTSFKYSPRLLTAIGTNLFAAVSGVYRSTDNGTSWTTVSTGLTNTAVYALVAFGTDLFEGTGNGMFRSTDSGASWIEVSVGLPIFPYVWAFAESGTSLFSSVSGLGVFRSSDTGKSWKSASKGLVANSVTALVTDGANLFGVEEGGASSGISLSTDSGATWNSVDTSLIEDITALAVSGSNLYAANDDLFLTTDRGMSWTMDTGLKTVSIIGNTTIYYTISSLGVFGTNLFAGLYHGGILRSTNGGLNWSPTDSGLPASVTVLLFTKIGSNLFAGTQVNGVYLSTDNGTSWASAGLSDAGGVNALAVSGTNLFAATGNVIANSGVFRSTDSGTSWTVENTGLTDTSVTALIASGTNLFAGTRSGGVFLTTNNGSSWTNVGLDSVGADVGITGFAIIGLNLYAATGIDESNEVRAGVWRRPLSDFGISSVTQTPPSPQPEIQTYPNPLSQSTTVHFTTSESGPVQVSVVNLLGEQVAQLFEGELGAGEHSFTWDAKDAPAGTYFCEIGLGAGVGTRHALAMVVAR